MLYPNRSFLLGWLMLVLAAAACGLPSVGANPNAAATMAVQTISAMQTDAAATQTQLAAIIPSPAIAALPSSTAVPSATATAQNPVVTEVTLCWTGPGPAYRVVSSIKAGTRVELLGVSSIKNWYIKDWYIIQNPTYQERCWIPAKYLKFDPGFDVGSLQIFNPPPTPGPKITPGPTETP